MSNPTSTALKQLVQLHPSTAAHWVGDGFPVRTAFDYTGLGREALSPFLLMDYAGPAEFKPATKQRGVGEHPHRGFETVTLSFQGEVEHRDSGGGGGLIGPGDVQWMTAASGVMHEEMHSRAFTERGGVFEMIQLWVNLPAKEKLSTPRYQTLKQASIPVVNLPDGGGQIRVIAGEYQGQHGPAKTVTPINLWDLQLKAGTKLELDLPEGFTTAFFVLKGSVRFNSIGEAGESMLARFTREGRRVSISATATSRLILLNGQPIAEPVVGHGPFVMNSMDEIRQAFADVQAGRFGALAPAGK